MNWFYFAVAIKAENGTVTFFSRHEDPQWTPSVNHAKLFKGRGKAQDIADEFGLGWAEVVEVEIKVTL